MVSMQDPEDWHPGTLPGAEAFHTCPQPHYAAHHCQPGLGWKSHVLGMRRDLEGLGLTVGVLGLLLHLAVLRVLTAEKAQTAEVSSGARGHLLSKCLKWPHDPAPHREWKPAGLRNRQSPATMEQALSLEGLPGRTWFLSLATDSNWLTQRCLALGSKKYPAAASGRT